MGQSRVDFDSLSDVLKNRTRRKIIVEISEKGSISYVDLMNYVGISNTGKFNYHLKILGDLLSKDPEGRYRLSEKGQLAVKFLQSYNGTENRKCLLPNGTLSFRSRAFSLFPGFIWLLLIYPILSLVFTWAQFLLGDPLAFGNNMLASVSILSFVGISAFILFTLATFPIIEIDRDGLNIKWGFNQKYFTLEEASIDYEGHVLKMGGGLSTFGWYIPIKEKDTMNLLDRQVKDYNSKPLFLLFLIPQMIFGIVFIGTKAPYGLFSPIYWAILWGVTTSISMTLFTYSSKIELRISKLGRGISSIILGILAGAIIAIIIFYA